MRSRLDIVVTLLHAAPYGALATHSTTVAGYPFASALPFVTDEHHRPVFFISSLAEHTQNLIADSRTSLLLAEAQDGDIQTGARATVIGSTAKIAEPDPLLVERYFRYHPETRDFLQLDFAFFRLVPERIRVIGGFGQAGWLEANQVADDAATVALQEEARMLEQLSAATPAGVRLLGLDAYGCDTRQKARRVRHSFDGGAMRGDALYEAVLHALQC